uniref:Sulfatase N-terminal domain-containing protein n=1 Tax=Branchiostoma floridae TaxID=7739 RepID=C3YF71_BRAFL|eukprot:XP_002605063.1 hypothetical protein BRAFLDRAFT_85209 [Branchiostoma floridae]
MARFTLLLVLIVALTVASAFRRKKRPGKGTTSEGTTEKAQTSKPNILFIVADDLDTRSMARFTLLLVLIVALAVASAFRRKKRPGKGTTSEGTTKKAQTSKPNILFIVADDLGWNDVGWHNDDVKTPNLDELAKDGVILNNSYYNPICTPSVSLQLCSQVQGEIFHCSFDM